MPTGSPGPHFDDHDSSKPLGLATDFMRAAQRYAKSPALVVSGLTLTYEELLESSLALAGTIQAVSETSATTVVGILGYRELGAYQGILGTLLAGKCYLPLNPHFPSGRNRALLERAKARILIVDVRALNALPDLLAEMSEPPYIIVAGFESETAQLSSKLDPRYPATSRLASPESWKDPHPRSEDYAYLLFTSGSTGSPKGVAIKHRNAHSLLSCLETIYPLNDRDRCSQCYELTFDGSVIDLFLPWARGASVIVPTKKMLMQPSRFIREHELSFWFSVPSIASFMKRFGVLKPGVFPSLRWSLFGGEALHGELAAAWTYAAPNSSVDNLYGPTEATVECFHYRWDQNRSPSECEQGITPLGFINPGMEYAVLDSSMEEVSPGSLGDLYIAGDQLAGGYWQDPERTRASFFTPPGKDRIHFRTGDRVRRPLDPTTPMTYFGRVDYQVQIRGHRVELGEVEAAAREICGTDAIVALAWPQRDDGTADGIELFIEGTTLDSRDVLSGIARRLPEYMIPRNVHFIPRLPRSTHGKLDRSAILNLLEKPQ